MVRVGTDWQHILVAAGVITEFGGTLVLFIRARAKQREYLRRFPPVAGVPLDIYWGGGPQSVTRAIWRVSLQRQSDPELERLRQEMWRRVAYYVLWLGGFPILVFGVLALLILSGLVTFTS